MNKILILVQILHFKLFFQSILQKKKNEIIGMNETNTNKQTDNCNITPSKDVKTIQNSPTVNKLTRVDFPVFRILVYSIFGLLLGITIEVAANHIEPYITSSFVKDNNSTEFCTKKALVHICIGLLLIFLILFIVLKLVDSNIPTSLEGLFFCSMFFIPLASLSDSINNIAKQCISNRSTNAHIVE